MPTSEGPFVQIATFCRDVIEQADGDVSLVGVTNHIHLERGDSGYLADLLAFLSIRAGALKGKRLIVLRPIGPDGQVAFPEGSFAALFEAGVSGVEIQVRLRFEPTQEGHYWFDVLLDGTDLLTRIPLTIEFEGASMGPEDQS